MTCQAPYLDVVSSRGFGRCGRAVQRNVPEYMVHALEKVVWEEVGCSAGADPKRLTLEGSWSDVAGASSANRKVAMGEAPRLRQALAALAPPTPPQTRASLR